MRQLNLYYTANCHLCDEAETILHATGYGECYTKVEIEGDPALLERYEIHIPVLERIDNKKELFWPFGPRELAVFMGGDK